MLSSLICTSNIVENLFLLAASFKLLFSHLFRSFRLIWSCLLLNIITWHYYVLFHLFYRVNWLWLDLRLVKTWLILWQICCRDQASFQGWRPRPACKLLSLELSGQLIDIGVPGGQAHLEHVWDDTGSEHPIRIAAEHQHKGDFQKLSETTYVARHLEERVDDAFILNDSIGQLELHLDVRCRVDSGPITIHNFVERQKIMLLRLLFIPDEKVGVLERDFIVI